MKPTRLKISIYKHVTKLFFWSKIVHSVWKSRKVSHLIFLIAFYIDFCPVKTDLSGNMYCLNENFKISKTRQIDQFWHFQWICFACNVMFNETFSVIFKHCEKRQLRHSLMNQLCNKMITRWSMNYRASFGKCLNPKMGNCLIPKNSTKI